MANPWWRRREADLAVVLDNLVENALNYSPTDSTVAIEWEADGDSARLVVLDEGPGIDPGERERVFERFFRGEASARRRAGNGPRPAAGGGARRAMGRLGGAGRPARGRHARRGRPAAACAPSLTGADEAYRARASLDDAHRNRRGGARHRRPGSRRGDRPGRQLDSGDSVGLSAAPLSAGDALAPAARARTGRTRRASGAGTRAERRRAKRQAARRRAAQHRQPPTSPRPRPRRRLPRTTTARSPATTTGARSRLDDSGSNGSSGSNSLRLERLERGGSDDNSGHGGGDDD